MNTMIPLREIPYEAREIEAKARRKLRSAGEDLLASARYEIVEAEGCYSGAFPQRIGWVLTERAASALASRLTYMPGGTCHHELSYRVM